MHLQNINLQLLELKYSASEVFFCTKLHPSKDKMVLFICYHFAEQTRTSYICLANNFRIKKYKLYHSIASTWIVQYCVRIK